MVWFKNNLNLTRQLSGFYELTDKGDAPPLANYQSAHKIQQLSFSRNPLVLVNGLNPGVSVIGLL